MSDELKPVTRTILEHALLRIAQCSTASDELRLAALDRLEVSIEDREDNRPPEPTTEETRNAEVHR